MKLRNKNTGEIVELSDEEYDVYKIFGKLTDCANIWIEYNPTIEDKKVRNLVKVWAKTFGFRTFRYVWNDEKKPAYGMLFGELSGEYPSATYRIDVPFDLKLDSSKCYTLDELLSDGEEEE